MAGECVIRRNEGYGTYDVILMHRGEEIDRWEVDKLEFEYQEGDPDDENFERIVTAVRRINELTAEIEGRRVT